MNPILKTIFEGVYDDKSILSSLRGTPHLIKKVWYILKNCFKSYIKLPKNYDDYEGPEGVSLENEVLMPDLGFLKEFASSETYDLIEDDVIFPKATDININMMPYISKGYDFEDYKLPAYLKSYAKLICFCGTSGRSYDSENDKGRIFYLTIQEGLVEPNESQRRPGIHTDNPGSIAIKNSGKYTVSAEGAGEYGKNYYEHHWGNGVIQSEYCHLGGIYMASNIPHSCRAWNCKIEKDQNSGSDVIGEHGSCEHLKEFLPKDNEVLMEANTLYWITDRTPHESLPLKERAYRQFFRVVTENVSLWFADHSTPNPFGVLPDRNITKIVKGNKFEANSLEIIDHDEYLKSLST